LGMRRQGVMQSRHILVLALPPRGQPAKAHHAALLPYPEGRPLSFTQRVLDDVRAQIAPEEAALKEARMANDLRFLVPLAGLEPATCCLGDVSA